MIKEYRVTVTGRGGKKQFTHNLATEAEAEVLIRILHQNHKEWQTFMLHDCYDRPVITLYRTSPAVMALDCLCYLATMYTPVLPRHHVYPDGDDAA